MRTKRQEAVDSSESGQGGVWEGVGEVEVGGVGFPQDQEGC